jgi:hypothetical protein
MGIKFQCTSCDSDFELEIPRIIDRPTALKCPKCDAKPQAHRAEALGTALEDLLSAMSAIRSKVRFQIALDTEALPPPYGPSAGGEGSLGGADDDDLAEGIDDEDEEEEAEAEDEDVEDEDDEDSDSDEDEEESEDEESEGGEDEDFDYDDEEDEDEEEEDEDD